MHVIISPFISSFPLKSKFALKNNFSFFLIIFFHFFYLLLIFIDLFSFSFLPFLLFLKKRLIFFSVYPGETNLIILTFALESALAFRCGFEINTFFSQF